MSTQTLQPLIWLARRCERRIVEGAAHHIGTVSFVMVMTDRDEEM